MLRRHGISRRNMAIMGGVLGAVLALAGSQALAATAPGTTRLDPFTLRTSTLTASSARRSTGTVGHTIRIPARPTARSAFRPMY